MIVGIGVDVVGLDRFAAALARTPSLRERLLAPDEALGSATDLAARFAAKEALAKALGAPSGLAWHDAEVRGTTLVLRGTVAAAAAALGVTSTHLRLSTVSGAAIALVVLESCAREGTMAPSGPHDS